MTLSSEARVATDMPRRYMTQLCKHFEHKLPVAYDDTKGRIEFSAGICLLEAAKDALILRAEAADTAALRQVEGVVARHLDRFAFREKPEIAWQETA